MNPLLGIGLKILAALAFTFISAAIKWLGPAYPAGQVVFFRSAFALVSLMIWLAWRGDFRASIRTSNLVGHAVRGLVGTLGMFAMFASLIYLPFSDAVVISYAAPLITVVFAAVFLGEQVRGYRWGAVGVGFVGVVVMISPHLDYRTLAAGGSTAALGAVFALLGAVCSAGVMIQIRRLTATETTGAIVFYFSILSALLGGATIVSGWTVPDLADAAVLVGIGLLGGIGQILMTQSYRFADASLIAPFDYVTMIWAFLIGWLLFAQPPGVAALAGAAIVAASGVFVIWRERRLARRLRAEAETSGRTGA